MMRVFVPAAAALALLTFQAQAQTTPATTPAPATTTAPGTAPGTAPAAPMKKPVSHHRTLQQRFDAANTAHDGHLTKDQATAANWPYVANNFAAMDQDKKGYVTPADIRAYAKARRAARQKAAPATTAPKPASNS